jgi:hypothetical protein
MSSLTVASRLGDRKLFSTAVVPSHFSRDPQYGSRAQVRFRVATRQGKAESQSIEFNLDRVDVIKLRDQLNGFLENTEKKGK